MYFMCDPHIHLNLYGLNRCWIKLFVHGRTIEDRKVELTALAWQDGSEIAYITEALYSAVISGETLILRD